MERTRITELAQLHGAELLDVKFVDLPGTWQHFTLPLDQVKLDSSDQLPFDGSSIRGFQEIHESDMYLLPDYTTTFVDPFSSRSLGVICDVFDPVKKENYSRDPRWVAKKAENYLKQSGVGDTGYFGPEAEFFIFDSIRFGQDEHSGFYYVDSEEGEWNSGAQGSGDLPNLGYKPRYKEGYFPVPPHDAVHEIRNQIIFEMKKCGLTVERHHHEVATAGQCEIGVKYSSLTRAADNLMIYKYLVKNVAKKFGKTATFMPKPLFNDNGSGMHTHQSIWKNGKNIFAGEGEGSYSGMSETALFYIGGLLTHAKALAAILSPTTNSYKRLVPGFEAPVNLAYSFRNRSAAVRIPVVENDAGRRIEYRPPDPSCNPYLAFAAMLMAGLDGIKKKIHPGEAVNYNIYEHSGERKIEQLPGSLQEAIACLEGDNAFLREGGVFTSDLLDMFIEMKRKKEIDPVRLRPHPWEFQLYYDV